MEEYIKRFYSINQMDADTTEHLGTEVKIGLIAYT
jgi:hypothetical protein